MNIKNNPQYDNAAKTVKLIRDCIEGEPTIKAGRLIYLKHPNAVDTTSPQQVARYDAYLDGAEFDGFPAETEKSMIGKMTEGEIAVELPEKIAYLEQNSDGDGMPLSGAVEIIYKNLLEVKFHILVAEYDGLMDVDTKQLSRADVKKLKLRSSIKHYSRESLIDWDFRRENGVMQLSLLVFLECATERDEETLETKTVKSWLILALDGDGHYYQQKYVEAEGVAKKEGERVYPEVGGSPLSWIPAEIVVDEEFPAGNIPQGFGYLYPICSAALSRYRVSADYKEALRNMQPTTFTSGWKQGDYELFKEINKREYIAFGVGVSNNMPDGVTADVKGLGVECEAFENYFKDNERKARALGAKIDDGSNMSPATATQSAIENGQRTAVFQMIVNNTEAALKRVISYCAMYEGLWSPDDVEANLDKINLTLPREFGAIKMTADEARVVFEGYLSGVYSHMEALEILQRGGFTVSDAEKIFKEMAQEGPAPAPAKQPGQEKEEEIDEEDEAENQPAKTV